MDGKILLAVCSVICLTILGVVVAYTQPQCSKMLEGIIAAIGVAGGIGGYKIIQKIRGKK